MNKHLSKYISHFIFIIFCIYLFAKALKSYSTDWTYYRWFLPFATILVLEVFIVVKNFLKAPKEIDGRISTFIVSMLSVFGYFLASFFIGKPNIAFLHNVLTKQIATVIFFIPYPLIIWSLLCLGNSFTVLPEANNLKVNGIYRFSRHPLYVCYMIWILSNTLMFASIWYALAAFIHFMTFVIRIDREEKILLESFPEYEGYAKEVGWLGPIGRL